MKNKYILSLILGIFLIGLVSASITGYVTRGSGVYDSGYTATLQKVDSKGVATISVQTPEGNTEFVRVAEGETAKVDGVEISASSLTRGTLFRRAGADVSLNITGPVEAIAIKEGAIGIGGGSGTGTNEACIPYYGCEWQFDYELVDIAMKGKGRAVVSAICNPQDFVVEGSCYYSGNWTNTKSNALGTYFGDPSGNGWRCEAEDNDLVLGEVIEAGALCCPSFPIYD